jgi:hypothetical protein
MRHIWLVSALLLTFVGCGDTDEPANDDGVGSDVSNNGNDNDDNDDDVSGATTVPTAPVPFTAGTVLQLKVGDVTNYVMVPRAYDASHQTPMQVFIYLHGCGGTSSYEANAASNINANWIGLAPGGAEGQCWDRAKHSVTTMNALADLKKHFNVNPKRVFIGGYSSGGDLSYYTAFRNAGAFAAILAYNSIPAYSGNELSSAIAGSAWKINIVHLAHTADDTYKIADVRARVKQLKDAGFPATLIERPGAHYDNNTSSDRDTLLYPYLEEDFRAP